MGWDFEAHAKLNTKHLRAPQPGDIWLECFLPILLVIATRENIITICRHTKPAGPNRYTYDMERLETVTRLQFRRMLTYGGRGEETHCDVWPGAGKRFSDLYREALEACT